MRCFKYLGSVRPEVAEQATKNVERSRSGAEVADTLDTLPGRVSVNGPKRQSSPFLRNVFQAFERFTGSVHVEAEHGRELDSVIEWA
jgi:hypothetical protein